MEGLSANFGILCLCPGAEPAGLAVHAVGPGPVVLGMGIAWLSCAAVYGLAGRVDRDDPADASASNWLGPGPPIAMSSLREVRPRTIRGMDCCRQEDMPATCRTTET